jgi:5'(3')-deoxyribonucleotidase
MNKLKILIDVDDTVFPLVAEAWLPRYNLEYKEDVQVQDIKTWDMTLYTRAGKSIYKYMTDPFLYIGPQPYPFVKQAVDLFRTHNRELVFVTAGFHHGKLPWLKRHHLIPEVPHGDVHNHYLVRKDKWNLSGDVLVDDNADTITEWVKTRGRLGILFDQPWNRDACFTPGEDVIRVHNWYVIPELVDNWERYNK